MFQALCVVAHAPCVSGAATEAQIRTWWEDFTVRVAKWRASKRPVVIMIDANARLGSLVDRH
eukprot:12709868-Alexandrium_andersonii.AAC.1